MLIHEDYEATAGKTSSYNVIYKKQDPKTYVSYGIQLHKKYIYKGRTIKFTNSS